MALETIMFYKSKTGTATFSQVDAAADTHLTVASGLVNVPPVCTKIAAILGVSNTATSGNTAETQISTPSLQASALLDVANFVANAAGNEFPGNEPPMDLFLDYPIPLVAGEQIQVLDTNTGTNNEKNNVALFMTDGNLSNPFTIVPPAFMFPMRFTGTTTVTAHAWSPVTLTNTQKIPVGTYAVMGAKAAGATAIAARFLFQNQGNRPGVPCVATLAGTVDPGLAKFRMGRMGLFGTFPQNSIPQMEFWCSAADTAQDVIVDLLKIA